MKESDFLKKVDQGFAEPCLRYFDFLKSDYGFDFRGKSIAHEAIASYYNDNVCIEIVFEIPNAPFITLQKVEKGKMKKEYNYKPKDKKIRKLIRNFNKIRDDNTFEFWFENFKEGKFNLMFDELLLLLANDIKSKISIIENGDMNM